MNSKHKLIDNELFHGRLDIAIILVNKDYYFIFDDKENFTIDIAPFYDSYLRNGIINKDQYEYAIKNYRGGAAILHKDNIFTYFDSLDIPPKNCQDMRNFFTSDFTYEELIKIYRENANCKKLDVLKARIPSFFWILIINIFFTHTLNVALIMNYLVIGLARLQTIF